ncbi:hypothetical protein [Gracilibacillus saliphilus]|uniref:hypothetical protein n=1 Tax=Gracilibacillus saliphilus TaxID=543890 RepID=UPI0013D460D9|nr:hypothetical protein [Gracilibacillus saliphilus]
MKQPMISVNGEIFKVHDVSFYEDGQIACVSYFVADGVTTVFYNQYTDEWRNVEGNHIEAKIILGEVYQHA